MTIGTILLIEDSVALAATYREYLRPVDLDVTIAETGGDALALLERTAPAVILLDLRLPDMDGIDILKSLKPEKNACPVIVITAHGSVTAAVEAMRAGAFDFLMKPFSADRLLTTVRNALAHRTLSEEVRTLRSALDRESFYGLLGSSAPMQAVYKSIESAAQSRVSIFITGESGTGKELCAEAVHLASPRASGPFVALNCAAIPKELVESEVFGHRKGSFTGATADREGAAGRANGGTLFLDEICEMEIGLQAKLLRFLQTQSYRRVGDDLERQTDIRFVCATNREPLEEVRAGRFREDLYYRLHVIPIEMPPLRQRGSDILMLAESFVQEFADEDGLEARPLSPEAQRALEAHAWPGNVRELRNRVHSAVVLCRTPAIGPADLGLDERNSPQTSTEPPQAAPDNGPFLSSTPVRPLWEVEREAIRNAVEACEGNINRAASALGISPSTIYRKMERWTK